MRQVAFIVVAVIAGLELSIGHAQEADDSVEADDPDVDFLEYLGSWQDNDEEWLIVSEWEPDESAPDPGDTDGGTPSADGKPEEERVDGDE